LPAFELSGFIFEIDSMPLPIRLLTHILPPRYFVSSLQTIFLAGDVPEVLVPNTLVLLGFAAVLSVLLLRATRSRLEWGLVPPRPPAGREGPAGPGARRGGAVPPDRPADRADAALHVRRDAGGQGRAGRGAEQGHRGPRPGPGRPGRGVAELLAGGPPPL